MHSPSSCSKIVPTLLQVCTIHQPSIDIFEVWLCSTC